MFFGSLQVGLANTAEIEEVAHVLSQVVNAVEHAGLNVAGYLRLEALETVLLRFESEDVASPQVFELWFSGIEPRYDQLHVLSKKAQSMLLPPCSQH